MLRSQCPYSLKAMRTWDQWFDVKVECIFGVEELLTAGESAKKI